VTLVETTLDERLAEQGIQMIAPHRKTGYPRWAPFATLQT